MSAEHNGSVLPNNRGLALARKALILGENPFWWHMAIGGIEEFEFSYDGNELFYNMTNSSSVRMLQGINGVYSQAEANAVAANPISVPTGVQSNVTSINFNPQDPNEMFFTSGNYGVSRHVALVERTPGTTSFRATPKQGNLPDFPVYDAVFDAGNPDRVIIGTDMGIWSTSDIHADPVVWVQEDFPNVPVFDLDQQYRTHEFASNHGMLYAGTHGAGIWKTGSIVGIDQISHDRLGSEWESQILVYPNPVRDQTQLQLTVSNPDNAEIEVYDISGQLVKRVNARLEAGMNEVALNVAELNQGTYFVTLIDGSNRKVAKFVKM